MDFGFTEEERALAETLRRYALEELRPHYARWDSEPFPRERFRDLAALGVSGLRVPAEYGGSEGSFVSLGIAAEEIARGDYNYTLIVQLTAIAAELLSRGATEAVKREWLPGVASGERIVAFGLTEPGAGSDAANLRTVATRHGDEYVITGEKASITFAGSADACVVFAKTGQGGARAVSAILVPLDRPGVSRGVYRSVGEKLTQRGSLVFEEVRVPVENRLGDESGGFVQAMDAFDYNRAIIALACVGAAQQSLDETIEWSKQRQTFGKPIARHEGVSFQIAEHLTAVEAARLLSYKCLWRRDRGEKHTKEAAMAKWMGPKVSVEAIHACLLLHGWMGYGEELPFSQRLRDVIGLEIGDGTPEIMKGIIARETIGKEFVAYR